MIAAAVFVFNFMASYLLEYVVIFIGIFCHNYLLEYVVISIYWNI